MSMIVAMRLQVVKVNVISLSKQICLLYVGQMISVADGLIYTRGLSKLPSLHKVRTMRLQRIEPVLSSLKTCAEMDAKHKS